MAAEQPADESASSPRDILIRWANRQDAWVRLLVGAVLKAQGPVGDDVIEDAFAVFLREKQLVESGLSAISVASPDGTEAVTHIGNRSHCCACPKSQASMR